MTSFSGGGKNTRASADVDVGEEAALLLEQDEKCGTIDLVKNVRVLYLEEPPLERLFSSLLPPGSWLWQIYVRVALLFLIFFFAVDIVGGGIVFQMLVETSTSAHHFHPADEVVELDPGTPNYGLHQHSVWFEGGQGGNEAGGGDEAAGGGGSPSFEAVSAPLLGGHGDTTPDRNTTGMSAFGEDSKNNVAGPSTQLLQKPGEAHASSDQHRSKRGGDAVSGHNHTAMSEKGSGDAGRNGGVPILPAGMSVSRKQTASGERAEAHPLDDATRSAQNQTLFAAYGSGSRSVLTGEGPADDNGPTVAADSVRLKVDESATAAPIGAFSVQLAGLVSRSLSSDKNGAGSGRSLRSVSNVSAVHTSPPHLNNGADTERFGNVSATAHAAFLDMTKGTSSPHLAEDRLRAVTTLSHVFDKTTAGQEVTDIDEHEEEMALQKLCEWRPPGPGGRFGRLVSLSRLVSQKKAKDRASGCITEAKELRVLMHDVTQQVFFATPKVFQGGGDIHGGTLFLHALPDDYKVVDPITCSSQPPVAARGQGASSNTVQGQELGPKGFSWRCLWHKFETNLNQAESKTAAVVPLPNKIHPNGLFQGWTVMNSDTWRNLPLSLDALSAMASSAKPAELTKKGVLGYLRKAKNRIAARFEKVRKTVSKGWLKIIGSKKGPPKADQVEHGDDAGRSPGGAQPPGQADPLKRLGESAASLQSQAGKNLGPNEVVIVGFGPQCFASPSVEANAEVDALVKGATVAVAEEAALEGSIEDAAAMEEASQAFAMKCADPTGKSSNKGTASDLLLKMSAVKGEREWGSFPIIPSSPGAPRGTASTVGSWEVSQDLGRAPVSILVASYAFGETSSGAVGSASSFLRVMDDRPLYQKMRTWGWRLLRVSLIIGVLGGILALPPVGLVVVGAVVSEIAAAVFLGSVVTLVTSFPVAWVPTTDGKKATAASEGRNQDTRTAETRVAGTSADAVAGSTGGGAGGTRREEAPSPGVGRQAAPSKAPTIKGPPAPANAVASATSSDEEEGMDHTPVTAVAPRGARGGGPSPAVGGPATSSGTTEGMENTPVNVDEASRRSGPTSKSCC
ncbi:unnamed protein product [Amoebophrya sp. A25]|nr:unnamed protein product [Amoebophrya sp. A25]|eukprot:GSA25T00020632001.1